MSRSRKIRVHIDFSDLLEDMREEAARTEGRFMTLPELTKRIEREIKLARRRK